MPPPEQQSSPLRHAHVLGHRDVNPYRSFKDVAKSNAMKGVDEILGQYQNTPIRTERATAKDDSVAHVLLNNPVVNRDGGKGHVNLSGYKTHVGPLAPPHGVVEEKVKLKEPDNRPLIDKIHEGTFKDAVGLQWFKNLYDLRMLIRKAHCFTLDDATSAMIADFSIAIAQDMDVARRLAIPPFPVTWIDLNNRVRINRMKELGSRLTPSAAGEKDGPVVERVGWLIHPAENGGFYATYITEVDDGIVAAPLSYWWHCGSSGAPEVGKHPNMVDDDMDPFIQELALGIKDSGVWPSDAYPCVTPLHADLLKRKGYSSQVRDSMIELAGELRHVWGFLIALGAGHLGAEARITPQPKHDDIRKMPNGKPLLPLEHKVLHLHLAKRLTPEKVVGRLITHSKHRWHEVRGHWRELKNPDGSVRKRVPVKPHERGDERLGKITKTYKVEK